jgi:ADP-heptose:LPS heptosyltransferase
MHFLTIYDRFAISKTHVIDPGMYLIDDMAGAQLLVQCGRGKMEPLNEAQFRPFNETQDWNGKKILFFRFGGFGDLILLTPVLREIKNRWPNCQIHVATFNNYAPVLHHLPFVDKTVKFPPSKEEADGYDAWVFLENAIERNPRAKEIHITDLFAEITGVSGIKNKLPEYRTTGGEVTWAEEGYPRAPGIRRIAIQVAAEAQCRTYPEQQMQEVMDALLAKGWEIFLLGARGSIQAGHKENVYNLTQVGVTFRQSCAIIETSDCVLAPDSALLHAAGALSVPAVGLYGAFPWKLRTAYCPTTFAIEGKGECSPCFHHVHLHHYFPKDGPCQKTGRCEVLASIKPERVVHKIEQIARGGKADNVVPFLEQAQDGKN